jgi:hypothetical protein
MRKSNRIHEWIFLQRLYIYICVHVFIERSNSAQTQTTHIKNETSIAGFRIGMNCAQVFTVTLVGVLLGVLLEIVPRGELFFAFCKHRFSASVSCFSRCRYRDLLLPKLSWQTVHTFKRFFALEKKMGSKVTFKVKNVTQLTVCMCMVMCCMCSL